MEQEIWKDIPGYEGLYQVSNIGNIKSLYDGNHKNYREKILKLEKNKYGYLYITLTKDKNRYNFRVHRLIAQTFIPNLENKPQVNHKNGIRYDNRIENLEWCTRSENNLHKYRILGYKNHYHINNPNKGNFGKYNFLSKKTGQYDIQGNFIRSWDSLSDINRELNFSQGHISRCCLGKKYNKTAYGFIWKYL